MMRFLASPRPAFSLIAAAMMIFAGLSATSALAQTAPSETLPAMTFTKGALVDPTTALSYYSNVTDAHGSSFTTGGGAIAPAFNGTPPEIKELTRALQDDVDLIYEDIHNQIETEFAFGARKGPVGALIDKSGTPFDQNMLFVDTVREAFKDVSGFTARYRIGKIKLTQQQFTDWTGVSDIVAACRLLAAGGIPASFHNGASAPADCAVSGSFDNVTILHVWSEVQFTTGGTWYFYDPSYKVMTAPTAYNLSGVTGDKVYTTGDAKGQLESGGTLVDNSTATIPHIRKPNSAALDSYLINHGGLLVDHLKRDVPTLDTDTTLGIGKIVPEYKPSGGWRDTSPPHYNLVGSAETKDKIYDQYRTTLTVQFWATGEKRLERKLYTDEVYGRRLGINTEFDNDNFQQGLGGGSVTIPVSLMIDDVAFDRFVCPSTPIADSCPASAATGLISLEITHPYRAADESGTAGKYAHQKVVKPLQRELPTAIVLGFGKVSPALLAKWSNEALDDKALPAGGHPLSPCGPHIGGEPPELCTEPFLQPAGDFKRQKMAASWLAQFSRMLEMQAAIGGALADQQHSIGIVTSRYTFQGFHNNGVVTGDPNYFGISNQFTDINVDSWVEINSRTSGTGKVNAISRSVAFASATLEGSLLEQMEDLPDAASTASRLGWANDPTGDDFAETPTNQPEDPCNQHQRTYYDFSGLTNSSDRTPLMVYEGSASGCSAAPVIKTSSGTVYGATQWIGQFDNLLDLYLNTSFSDGSHFHVTAPAESFLGPGGRFGPAQTDTTCFSGGIGCDVFPYNLPSRQRGAAVIATRTVSGSVVQVAHVLSTIDGISKGGGGKEPEREATYDPKKAADILKDRFVDKSVALGVDLKTGLPGYTTPSLIKVGKGDEPYALDYKLSFKAAPSGCSPQFGPCTSPPQGGWTHNWDYRFTLSGSGLEALGQGSPRAAAGSLLSFIAMQDIYGTSGLPDVKKDFYAGLVADWWRRQMTGNVATISQGFSGRQFVRLPEGDWLAPTGSPAQLTQINERVKYRDDCQPAYDNSQANPVSTSRRWDNRTGTNRVRFTLTEADGRVMTVEPWEWGYLPDINECAITYGFKVNDLTWPQGPKIEFVTDDPSTGSGGPLNIDPGRVMEVHSKLTGSAVSRSLRVATRGDVIGAIYQAKSLTPSLSPVVGLFNGQIKNATGDLWNFDYALEHPRTVNLRQVPFPELVHVFEPVNPDKPALEYSYDRMGRVNRAFDAVSLQWHSRRNYDFYIADGRGERRDPQGANSSGAGHFVVYFDTDGNAVRHIDEVGAEIDSTYDGLHRVESRTYPEGDKDVFSYDDRDNVTSLVRKAKSGSGLTDLTISASWNLDYAKPWNGPESITNARAKTTTFAYYNSGAGKGLLHTVTRPNPGGGAPVYTYTYTASGVSSVAAGLLATETDPTGRVTRRTYDDRGNLTAEIAGDVAVGSNPHLDLTTTFADYTDWGDAETITYPSAQGPSGLITRVTTRTFDNMRRKTDEEERTGDKDGTPIALSHWVFDGLGRVTTEKHASALTGSGVATDWATTSTAYTPTSKTWKVTDPDGETTVTSYDNVDRVSQVADGSGRVTAFTYDLAGQKLTETRGVGTPAEAVYATYNYTPNGQVNWVRDGKLNKTAYGYDGFDRLIRTKFPDPANGTPNGADDENLTYDENGNVRTRQTRSNVTITNTYDALDRLTHKLIPASSYAPNRTTDYEYDAAGRRTHAYDSRAGTPAFDLTWGYDAAGRNITTTVSGPEWPSAQTKTVSYTLDDAGNRQQLIWPDNYKIDYSFDGLNRMVSVVEHTGGATLATFTYDPLSRRTLFTDGGGSTASYDWTKRGDLSLLSHNLNGTGNDVSFDATNGAGVVIGFDGGHRLTKETISNLLYQWTGATVATTSYAPDRLNRYSTIDGVSLTYDANANLTGDGTSTYSYDPENWLLTATMGGTTTSYLYDPLGRRVQSAAGASSTAFLHADDEEIGDYDSAGALILRYIPGPEIDRPIGWVTAGGGKRYFHADRRGSIIVVTKPDGSKSEGPYSYDAYGAPSDTGGTPIKYTGRRYDAESKLYYYRARYYSPALGRFLQTDPIGYDADTNLYAYVGADPVNRTDPLGLAPLEIVDACRNNSCTSPEQAARNAQFVADHPGEVMQVIGAAISLIPTPQTKAVGGAVSGAGAAVRLMKGDTAVPASPRAAPNFLVTPKGEAIVVPKGSSGPTPTRAAGMQFTGGRGGNGLDSRVSNVRVMESNSNQGPRVSYENSGGQKVNPTTGRTVSNSDPSAHIQLDPWK